MSFLRGSLGFIGFCRVLQGFACSCGCTYLLFFREITDNLGVITCHNQYVKYSRNIVPAKTTYLLAYVTTRLIRCQVSSPANITPTP